MRLSGVLGRAADRGKETCACTYTSLHAARLPRHTEEGREGGLSFSFISMGPYRCIDMYRRARAVCLRRERYRSALYAHVVYIHFDKTFPSSKVSVGCVVTKAGVEFIRPVVDFFLLFLSSVVCTAVCVRHGHGTVHPHSPPSSPAARPSVETKQTNAALLLPSSCECTYTSSNSYF